MPATDTAGSKLSYEEIDNGESTLHGIWTCNNPDLAGEEEHVMGEGEADTFEELADKFGAHYHGDCMDCEAYNAHYEGSLDRVEIVDANGEVIQIVEPEKLVQEYGMADDYGKFRA